MVYFSIHRKLISAELSARRPRKQAKITSAMANKRLIAWAKAVQNQFGNDWSTVRNINFALSNQLNFFIFFPEIMFFVY